MQKVVHHNRLLISWLIWWVAVRVPQLICHRTLLICLTLAYLSMTVLLDTGPWVALLSRNDTHHQWAVEQFRLLPPPMLRSLQKNHLAGRVFPRAKLISC